MGKGNNCDSETQEDAGPFQALQNVADNIEQPQDDILNEGHEHFGNQIRKINIANTLRIGFININGMPMTSASPKNKLIYNAIENKQIGILGLVELNRCWHLLPDKDKWNERTRGWWESSHCTMGYNRNDNTLSTAFQQGGSAIISVGQTSHRVIQSGRDPSGLGRWSWTLYRGKHNVTIRSVSVYRPCKPSIPGPNSAYTQHKQYLDRIGDDRWPRDAIVEDLGQCIDKWRNSGDQIIVMGDFNEDVTNQRIQAWSTSLQLSNAISQLHPIQQEPTFHRGTTSIDAIFVSHTIKAQQGGYLPFGSFPSDHRGLWIDITMDNAFSYKVPKSMKFKARRLKSNNAKVRNKWIQIYEEHIRKHHLHLRQFQLEATITQPMTIDQIAEYEDIRKNVWTAFKRLTKGAENLQWAMYHLVTNTNY
jgi:hypothetical protein